MRYRSDMPEASAASADENMVLGTAVYALFLGLGLCFGGWLGGKYWIVSMGALLFASAAAYLAGRLFGWW